MYKCKFCNREFEKYQQLGGHIVSKHITKNQHTRKEKVTIVTKCKKCDKSFHFEKIKGKKTIKEFCSRKCANSRNWSAKDKEKKSKAIRRNQKIKSKTIICYFKDCKNEMILPLSSKRQFCSKSCVAKQRFLDNPNLAIEMGKKSALKRSNFRRSKNEICFAELCKKQFDRVLTNEKIFNGWDADVIITSLKLAILWNGVWHYKKVCKSHSLKQVQNRDKIKLKEIKKLGYQSYVIKDEKGAFNFRYVKDKFLKFLKELKLFPRFNISETEEEIKELIKSL